MDYFPIVGNDGRWMVKLKYVVSDFVAWNGVRRRSFISHYSEALIDTGTSYIIGPRLAVNKLNRQIGKYLDCSDLTNSNHPNVTFSFGKANNTFVLTAKDYIHGENEAFHYGSCFSKFSPHDQDYWILGDTFM